MSTSLSAKSLEQWLNWAADKLNKGGIGSARLDALILLEDELNKDRAWLLAHPQETISKSSLGKLDEKLQRRVAHEPLAYIRNKTEFYGLEFYVDKRVLESRPESETMIEIFKSLNFQGGKSWRIIDAGTGSGALAVAAGKILPAATIYATDNDSGCLAVAKKNARNHGVKIRFYQTDLLKGLAPKISKQSVLLANLPYVPNGFRLNKAAQNEPTAAIFGGKDGLDLYRRLFKQLDSLEAKPKYLLTESLPPQHNELARLAKKHGYRVQKEQDFIQLFCS